ncbi:MAG: DMT family transporter [Firmicutes bacterium]|nr:DMT family transporter [Bacillota bacterium]
MANFQSTAVKAYGYLMTFCCAVIMGTEAVLAQLCYAGGFSVITILAVRYVMAAAIFVAVARIKKLDFTIPKAERKIVLLLGMMTVFGITVLFLAFALLPAALAILFLYAYPSLTALVAKLFFHQKLNKISIIALAFSAIGLVMLYWTSAAGLSVLGVVLALLAALNQSFKLNILEKHLPNLNLIVYNSIIMLIAAAVFLAAAPFSKSFSLAVEPKAWLYAALLGVGVTVISNFFMTVGVNIIGAVEAGIIFLAEPPTTALLAFLLFGDQLTLGQMAGGILILLAAGLPSCYSLIMAKKHSAAP